MNFRIVLHQLGVIFVVLGTIMLLLAGGVFGVLTWLHRDFDIEARNGLLLAGATGLLIGGAAWLLTRKGNAYLGRREALLLVALSWLFGAALAAMPLLHWARTSPRCEAGHAFRSFWACYFEAMSGLTTTGATVIADVEALPPSLLLWRAILHWFGGMGILVLFVTVLPSVGASGKRTFRSEAAAISKRGIRPAVRDAARTLGYIYVGLTALQFAALFVAGMPLFDAVCHSLAAVATGGFSTKNAGVAHFHSASIEIILIVFMIIAGVKFAMYERLFRGEWRTIVRDRELRLYLILMLSGAAILTIALMTQANNIEMVGGGDVPLILSSALRHSAFAASSMQTTTGFVSADFNHWPFIAKAVIVLLMLVGGCAGSTASGLKVIRVWIVFKVLHREIERIFRPHIVRPVRLSGAAIDDDLKLATLSYVLGFLMLAALGSVVLMLCESAAGNELCTFTTAATASIATLCNVGPGFELVGPGGNYGWFSTPSLVVMSVLMALGRLEIFAIFVLFVPRFWRGTM